MWSINGISYYINNFQKNQVLIDSCAQLGFDIPRFCYHENLKIAGNCRMCLVEDTKSPKPVISCAGAISSDLNIYTNTVQVKKARESVMEFLLINHPLDCPICDQGGECDLQDLSLVYGSDHGRFYDYKRNIEDKNCGVVVKTVMNRCILCTRCVRFAVDVAGFNGLGLTGRGSKMEIGSYVEKILDSELSGNLIDVCPVGALTSKPYSFVARPWELKKFTVFTLLDDQPQLVRLDLKENEIVRILPGKNSKNYNFWISNKTRFSYEGVNRYRLTTPCILGLNCSWQFLLNVLKLTLFKLVENKSIKNKFNTWLQSSVNALNFTTLEELTVFKSLLIKLGASNLIFTDETKNSMLFLPRTKFFSCGGNDEYKLYAVFSTNIIFETPIAATVLTKQVQKFSSFCLAWRSILTPLLVSHTISINSTSDGIINFMGGKVWINLLYPMNTILFILKMHLLCLFNTPIKNNTKMYNLFLVNNNISCRGMWDVDLTSLYNHSRNRGLQSLLPHISYTSGGSGNIIDNKNIFSLAHNTHFSSYNSTEFLLPGKTYFEKSGLYYDTDYSLVQTVKVLSVSINLKNLSSLVKVLTHLFSIKKLDFFNNYVYITNLFFDFTDLQLSRAFFVKFNDLYRTKIISRREVYEAYSFLTFSPTLASIENNSLLLNIY